MVSSPPGPRAAGITLADEDGAVTITVLGALDESLATLLLADVETALAHKPTRIDLDLCALTGSTPAGAAALVTCRELCGALPEGLHYRTNDGPGREALLTAFDEHADTDLPA